MKYIAAVVMMIFLVVGGVWGHHNPDDEEEHHHRYRAWNPDTQTGKTHNVTHSHPNEQHGDNYYDVWNLNDSQPDNPNQLTHKPNNENKSEQELRDDEGDTSIGLDADDPSGTSDGVVVIDAIPIPTNNRDYSTDNPPPPDPTEKYRHTHQFVNAPDGYTYKITHSYVFVNPTHYQVWHSNVDINKFVDCGDMIKCYDDPMTNDLHVPASTGGRVDWFENQSMKTDIQVRVEGHSRDENHSHALNHYHNEIGDVRHFHFTDNGVEYSCEDTPAVYHVDPIRSSSPERMKLAVDVAKDLANLFSDQCPNIGSIGYGHFYQNTDDERYVVYVGDRSETPQIPIITTPPPNGGGNGYSGGGSSGGGDSSTPRQTITIIGDVETETPPAVDTMQQVVEVEEPEPEIPKVYTQFQFYRGWNIFAPSVQLENIETIKDFWDAYSFLEAWDAIIYVNVDGLWYSYNSEGGMAADVPLNPYTAMVVHTTGPTLLGMRGVPYPRPDGDVTIPIGMSLVAFPMLPSEIQRPSDFIDEYGAEVVIVAVKGVLKLVGRADDPGDEFIMENQGVLVITINPIMIDFPEVPQAPQAHRAGTVATTWGAIKESDF